MMSVSSPKSNFPQMVPSPRNFVGENNLSVACVSSFEELDDYRQQWDKLAAGCLFRSWVWQSTWWKHYGESRSLHVLLVFKGAASGANNADAKSSAGQLIGILPTYIDTSFGKGKVVRLLGDGEVCSDHLDVLAEQDDIQQVVSAIAKYFLDHPGIWDATDFNATGADQQGLNLLGSKFEKLGCQVIKTPNVSRWSIPLPSDWESFLAMLSKSHRKKLRRLERSFMNSPQSAWHQVQTQQQFDQAWPVLIDLHQRRRNRLNEPGCFASKPWAGFHNEMAQQLLGLGRLRISWLELDGSPIAAEYEFASSNTTYSYQSGLDPDRLKEQPGRLSLMLTIQHAIKEGHTVFDLMRGDENYKRKWRAEPVATFDIRIVSPNTSAVIRNHAITYLRFAVNMARSIRGRTSLFD